MIGNIFIFAITIIFRNTKYNMSSWYLAIFHMRKTVQYFIYINIIVNSNMKKNIILKIECEHIEFITCCENENRRIS